MPTSSPTPTSHLPRHPIRVVALRTGLSGHVLRAWERRYGVVAPTRSEGGQRLYSDEDIERLALLRRLTDAGGSISQLASLSSGELSRLVAAEVPPAPDPTGERAAEEWRAGALRAIEALDGTALRRELERSALALGAPRFLEQVAGPVLQETGVRWKEGRLDIAQEHLATAVVREVLGWIRESAETAGAAPTLVVATPPEELHEGGALLVAAMAAAHGWKVTYLGPNLPARDVAAAAVRTGARAVALSVVHRNEDQDLPAQVEALRQALPAGVLLLVGGADAERHRQAVEAVGGRVVTTLGELPDLLHRLEGRP